MAKFLGSTTINLSKDEIDEKDFDLITIVHVLEHLDKPLENLMIKNNLSEEGIIIRSNKSLWFPTCGLTKGR